MTARPHDRFRSLFPALLVALLVLCGSVSRAYAADTQYTVKGGGYGHGIGLSQYGARGYAKKGWSYEKIVTYYYQGTKIVTKPTQKVKVNLDAGGGSRSQWWIKAGSSTALSIKLTSDTSDKLTLNASDSYWVVTSSGKTKVYTDKVSGSTHSPGTLLKTFSGECYATAGGFVKVVGTSGPFSNSGVIWRGTIHFRPTSTTSNTSRAINYVDIEDYLYGVVPREMPSSWPSAALRAQAIAARSYAYQDAADGKIIYCTTSSQVYNGYKAPSGGEVSATNAAVDDTEGMVVWYGSESKPVKTYFSASSGGHTANIEDVWGSAAKPYYTGVEDADQDNPYYTWTSGPYTPSTLAAKIRDKDNGSSNTDRLDYSAPSPATITKVSVDSASTGHARYVTLTWSNGASYKIRGDVFRSALGLKSTNFTVTTTNPVSPSSTRYSSDNSKLAWVGPWRLSTNSSYYGGRMYVASLAGTTARASFSGTGVAWIGSKGPGYGKAAVYLDGKLVKTVDLYSASTKHRQKLYSNTSLKSGKHTLYVKVLGKRNSKSSGNLVGFDGIQVYAGSLSKHTAPLVRYQQTASALASTGSWKKVRSSKYSGGSVVRTSSKGARFHVKFYGNEIRWIGTAADTYGRATVSVDGGTPQTVTITNAAIAYRKVLFRQTGLAQDKAHTLTIEVLGTGGTKKLVAVDAFDVRGGWLLNTSPPATTIQQTDAALSWKGGWKTSTGSRFSARSHRWSTSKGASVKITFDGNRIAWIDKKASNYGKAAVYLDGKKVATVDQYASKSSWNREVWNSGRLSSKRHTLEIRVLDSKRSAATDTIVGVDALKIWGQPVR